MKKKKSTTSIWVHICQYVQYYYVYTRFFALDKDWDFISVNLHRHSNIQGMYNLIFLNLWTNGNKKYILTKLETSSHKKSAATNSTWLAEHLSTKTWLMEHLSTSQVLSLNLEKLSHHNRSLASSWSQFSPFAWRMTESVGCYGYRFRRQTRLCSLCQCSCWHLTEQYEVFQQQWYMASSSQL